jgi:hypothetical protein
MGIAIEANLELLIMPLTGKVSWKRILELDLNWRDVIISAADLGCGAYRNAPVLVAVVPLLWITIYKA